MSITRHKIEHITCKLSGSDLIVLMKQKHRELVTPPGSKSEVTILASNMDGDELENVESLELTFMITKKD
tara:strand:+ start:25 stop:234 length:210 start_codon:yes stop_codon:yes gene_type:complete